MDGWVDALLTMFVRTEYIRFFVFQTGTCVNGSIHGSFR